MVTLNLLNRDNLDEMHYCVMEFQSEKQAAIDFDMMKMIFQLIFG